MGIDLNRSSKTKTCLGHAASAIRHEFDQQCLRILRCTAQAMASGPGGLRFKAGTRPWLEGLAGGLQAHSQVNGRCRGLNAKPAAD